MNEGLPPSQPPERLDLFPEHVSKGPLIGRDAGSNKLGPKEQGEPSAVGTEVSTPGEIVPVVEPQEVSTPADEPAETGPSFPTLVGRERGPAAEPAEGGPALPIFAGKSWESLSAPVASEPSGVEPKAPEVSKPRWHRREVGTEESSPLSGGNGGGEPPKAREWHPEYGPPDPEEPEDEPFGSGDEYWEELPEPWKRKPAEPREPKPEIGPGKYVTVAPAEAPVAPPSKEAVTDPVKELSRLDRAFARVTGSVSMAASLGKQTARVSAEGFRTRARQFKNIKQTVYDKITDRAVDAYHKKVTISASALEGLSKDAQEAKLAGNLRAIRGAISRMGDLLNVVDTPRLQHWASKIGLAVSDQDIRLRERERYIRGIRNTPNPSLALQAKAKGDWYGYQKGLRHLSRGVELMEAYGASPEEIDDYIAKAEHALGSTRQGSPREEYYQAYAEHRNAKRRQDLDARFEEKALPIRRYLNIDNIMELKDEIDHALGRADAEATLLGNQKQIGYDPSRIRQEVTARYLEKYFGAPLSELIDGKKVPLNIQSKVRELLGLPMKRLEAMKESRKNYKHNPIDAIGVDVPDPAEAAKAKAAAAAKAAKLANPKPAAEKRGRRIYPYQRARANWHEWRAKKTEEKFEKTQLKHHPESRKVILARRAKVDKRLHATRARERTAALTRPVKVSRVK